MAAAKKPDKKLIYLVALLAVVALFTYRKSIFGGGAAQTTADEARIAIDPKVGVLRALPALQIERPANSDDYRPRRNLFDFSTDPAIERQRDEARRRQIEDQKRAEEARKKAAEQERKWVAEHGPRPVLPPPPPPAPVPPSFGTQWRYIAYFRQGSTSGEYIAVLQKAGGKPNPVRVGESVDTAFVVKKIDFDAVTIGYTDPQFKDRTETVKLIPSAPGKGTK